MPGQRILIFRIGSLGDTLVGLPAMWTLREHFRASRLTLLCDHHPRAKYVLAPDLIKGSGLVDDVILYPVDNSRSGRLLQPFRMARLLLRLRLRRFDAVVYLAPTYRDPLRVERDRRFFRAAGISRMIGFEGFAPMPPRGPEGFMPLSPREADQLLSRLRQSGIPVPGEGQGRRDLGLGDAEQQDVLRWLATVGPDGGRRWISVGPGSKQPVNIWPAERYQQVVARLIERFDVWPVVFGGPEDRALADRLLAAWGRGYCAAGALSLRASAAAIGRCALHLGNDTGTMHLAASAGVPCVVVFSSHDPPGVWYPYGLGHRVLRTPMACEGCLLKECVERRMECILRIDADQVFRACSEVLEPRP